MLEFTQEFVDNLRKAVIYKDGVLYWNIKKGSMKIGEICGGTSVDRKGYRVMTFSGVKTSLHRFIWLYHYGPYKGDIDHRDKDRQNNRIENLRNCTRSENLKNRGKFKGCTSKYKGVYFRKDIGKWQAAIHLNGKTKHIGVFESELAAHAAWVAAATAAHGEFFRCE